MAVGRRTTWQVAAVLTVVSLVGVAGSDPGGATRSGDAATRTVSAPVDLVAPVLDVATEPRGPGHWLVAADGGVFAFGGAPFLGSLGGVELNAPVVGMAAVPDGGGYWLVAADGGVFAFGSAEFHGGLGDLDLAAPIIDVSVSADGDGYLLVAADGGVFAFGSVVFPGSAAGLVGERRLVTVAGGTDAPVLVAADGARWVLSGGTAHPLGPIAVAAGHEVVAADGALVVDAYRHRRFRLTVTGDVLLHGVVQRAAWNGSVHDFTPMFVDLEPVIRPAELALCHLEVVISATDDDLATFPRFRAPRAIAPALAATGYDGCSTSSNHSLDWGLGGVASTLDALDAAGLGHTGTARSADEAGLPRIYLADGVRVAHLSYAYGFNGFRVPDDAPWAANQIDPDRIRTDAARARDAGAEFVVVSLHWGAEYVSRPIAYQREVAEAVLPSPDVDLLVGHHAHVVQPIGRMGDEYVVYGLGNLISGQVRAGTRDGVAVTVEVVERRPGELAVERLAAVPLWTDRPYAVRRAVTGGSFSASAERTMTILRSEGVEVVEGTLPVP